MKLLGGFKKYLYYFFSLQVLIPKRLYNGHNAVVPVITPINPIIIKIVFKTGPIETESEIIIKDTFISAVYLTILHKFLSGSSWIENKLKP